MCEPGNRDNGASDIWTLTAYWHVEPAMRYRREFVTSAPLSWLPVHAEPLRMRTNAVYISELCEDCTVSNEIDYAWTSIHDNGQGVTASDVVPPRGGGGGHSPLKWVGGAAGGFKTWPCHKPLGTQKYTLSQYTLLKTFICIPCRNISHLE